MASQLGTGKALGTVTGAEDARRLIGGTPQVGAGTPIGGRSFDLPALRPAASPVNTYFESRGPILGGPVVIPRPPELPQPSGDMAALAKSLGSFSAVLDAMGETYVAVEKMRQDKADIAGRKAAADVEVKYPGQGFAQIRDQLYKKASAGDLEARAMYERLQALSPLQLAYANRHLEIAATRNEISTAPGRWASMTEVQDENGNMVPKESLPPNHPAILRAQQQLIRINTSDPVVYKQFEASIYATHSNLTTAQVKTHNAYKFRQSGAALQEEIRSNLLSNAPMAEKIMNLSLKFNDLREALGPEEYANMVKLAPDMFYNSAVGLAMQKDGGSTVINMELAKQYLNQAEVFYLNVVAGPNNEKLSERLGAEGGAAGFVDSFRKGMQLLSGLRNSVRGVAEAEGEDIAEQYIQAYGLRDPAVMNDAQLLNTRTIQANAAASADARLKNPAAFTAFQRTLKSAAETSENLGSARIQQNFAEVAAGIANSDLTGEEKIALLKELKGADEKTLRSYFKDAEAARDEDNKPYAAANRDLINRIMKEREAALKLPGVGGNTGLSEKETIDLVAEKRGLQLKLREIAKSVRDKGGDDLAVAAAQENFLKTYSSQVREQANQETANLKPPVIPDVNKFNTDYNKIFTWGVPSKVRTELNKAVQYGKVVPKEVLASELESFIRTNKLSPQMEFIIKTSGYSRKVDQFFQKQWKNSFPDVPFPTLQPEETRRLKDLQLSNAAPAPTLGGSSSYAHSLANNVLNALTGTAPAVAATMPTTFETLPQLRRPTIQIPVAPAPQPRTRQGDTPPTRVPVSAAVGNYAVAGVYHPQTGRGFAVPGVTDRLGRPVVLSQGAANAYHQMVRDSKGAVKYSDIESAQRSVAHNAKVGGAADSNHLRGNAIDVHGGSRAWIKKHGQKYGWVYLVYPGGDWHFDYRGS